MAKYEVLIKAVTVQKLSYGEVARRYGVSKTLVHKLHHRWLEEGDAAFRPRSTRPRASPTRTPDHVRDRVLQLRDELTAAGHDAGADTICEHLHREHITVSRVTIWRILKAAGQVAPQPQKRPRSSWIRFTADRPNELWQSDFTHVTPPTAPTSKSSAGSTTTPATCCTSAPTAVSPAASSPKRSPTPLQSTTTRPRRSPTTA